MGSKRLYGVVRPGAFLDAITQLGGDPFAKSRLIWVGSATIPLAELLDRVGATGSIVGVDRSLQVLATAVRRCSGHHM